MKNLEHNDLAQKSHFGRRLAEPARNPTPAELDRLADLELSFGRVQAAEYYSRRAAEMRLIASDQNAQRVEGAQ